MNTSAQAWTVANKFRIVWNENNKNKTSWTTYSHQWKWYSIQNVARKMGCFFAASVFHCTEREREREGRKNGWKNEAYGEIKPDVKNRKILKLNVNKIPGILKQQPQKEEKKPPTNTSKLLTNLCVPCMKYIREKSWKLEREPMN